MKKAYISLTLLLSSLSVLAQQDPMYNMYQFNQMIINPGYAGARDNLAIVALRRQQWAGIDGGPETNCLSVHGPVLNKKMGLGITLLSDRIGPRNVTAIYSNAAYILKLNERMKLSFGLSAGYSRFQFNQSSIELKSGQTPTNINDQPTQGALDLNSGVYLRSNSFFVGLSATHLNSPGVDIYQLSSGKNNYTYQLKTHLFLTVGKSFSINENLVIAPTILVRQLSGKIAADLNLNFLLHKRLWLGGFYRQGFGPGGLVQFYFSNKLRAGISYDTGLGDAMRLGSSFEAMFGFDLLGTKPRTADLRFL